MRGGVIDAASAAGADLRYAVSASATPSGVVAADAYEFYTGEILDRVTAAGDDLDGICLCLHGAMVPEGMDDGEGPFVAAIREQVGPDVPIAVTGSKNHLGRTVHLRCGVEDGVHVLVTENRPQPLDAEIWRHAGIQPERLDVLVVKSTNHYRADYEPMASEVIQVNSPGLVAMDPRKFEFEHVRRPQFPLDRMADDAYPDWD